MQTDPQNLKWKTDNDLKTAIISTILGQLAFSFLLVLNFITCLFRVLMINFSTFLLSTFLPIFKKEKNTQKITRFSDLLTLPRLWHVGGNKAIFILRLTAKLINVFVFATPIVQFLFFSNRKFQASNHLLWLPRPLYVRPGRKSRRPVFWRGCSDK